jgi:hypothetical protein
VVEEGDLVFQFMVYSEYLFHDRKRKAVGPKGLAALCIIAREGVEREFRNSKHKIHALRRRDAPRTRVKVRGAMKFCSVAFYAVTFSRMCPLLEFSTTLSFFYPHYGFSNNSAKLRDTFLFTATRRPSSSLASSMRGLPMMHFFMLRTAICMCDLSHKNDVSYKG